MQALDDTPAIRLPLNTLFRRGSQVLSYRGRAQDKKRQHLFVDDENVPEHMTDKEFVTSLAEEILLPVTREQLDLEKGERPPKSLALATSSDVTEMARRRAYVRAWVRANRPSQSEAGLSDLVREVGARTGDAAPPGWRTVARWIRSWLLWGEDDEALLPGKGGNRMDRLGHAARSLLTDTVTENYCLDTRPTAKAVHRSVVEAFRSANAPLPEHDRIPVPSYQAVLGAIASIDRYTLEFTRVGRRSAEHKFRAVGTGPVVSRHNEAWEIDHTTVDAIVVDEETSMPIGRARVSACLDRATRCCTSLTMGFEPPSAEVALECLAVGVMPKDKLLTTVPDLGSWPCFGAPDEIVSDQGSDLRSAAFKECCRIIGPDVEHSPVLKAWYRGRIERFFRTLSREVFHRVPGTTFANFFLRNKEAIPETIAVCTLGELWEWSLRFVVDIYNRRPHASLGGKSPLQLWNESVGRHGLKPPPTPSRIRLGRALPEWRKPQRYGFEVNRLIYQSRELISLRVRQDCPEKLKVLVNPDDLTEIRVVDPFSGSEITVPIRPDLKASVRGVSLRKHRMALAMQRENPERLAGLEGVAKAYRLLDAAMAAKRRHGGLRNATEAARYFASLSRARPVDAPPVVDAVASGRSFVDEIMDDDEPAAHQQDGSNYLGQGDGSLLPLLDDEKFEEPMPVTEKPQSRKPSRRREPRSGRQEVPVVDQLTSEPSGEELDALVSELGLRISRRDGGRT